MREEDRAKLGELLGKAAADESFKKKFKENPKKVLAEQNIPIPEDMEVKIHENTKHLYHLVVQDKMLPKEHQLDTLPANPNVFQISSFIITNIQKNTPLKEKLLKNPLEVLKEEGVDVPEGLQLKVLQNSPKTAHIVIPASLEEGEELSDLQLQEIAGGKHHHHHHGGQMYEKVQSVTTEVGVAETTVEVAAEAFLVIVLT
ncbi:MAG: hypothetical protein Tsb0015_08000 [Simkaniaceae bacterium]